MRPTQEIYYKRFDNSEIMQSLSRGFTLQEERVFHNCYFEWVIFVLIFLGPNTYPQLRRLWTTLFAFLLFKQ